MSIAFSATNPCHVYPMACELARRGRAGVFYSGYPSWKLDGKPEALRLHIHCWRTLVTYGLLRLPEAIRPPERQLFRWQDVGFDRAVAGSLESDDCIHGIPGQCLETFRRARSLGMRTVLNHATGPLELQEALVRAEFERVGERFEGFAYPEALKAQILREYDLADAHCVASHTVKTQLEKSGVASERIWVVPYGADPGIFSKSLEVPEPFRICFAGQLSLRKGVYYLLRALERVGHHDWEMHFYGHCSRETRRDLESYRGACPLYLHEAVSQVALAKAMRSSRVLVLPSVEDAFGLVVPQALQSGTPVIASDRVGAKDLLRQRENGSIYHYANVDALGEELIWWSQSRIRVQESYDWKEPADILLRHSDEV